MATQHAILSISVWKQLADPVNEADTPTDKRTPPICVAMVNRFDPLGTLAKTFHSGTIKETIIFTCRVAVGRIHRGKRAHLELPHELPYDLYIYVSPNGLSCCIIADPDYHTRTIFGLCIDVLRLFEKSNVATKIENLTEDKFLELPQMKEKIDTMQNPDKDQLQKVSDQVDDIKGVMRQNIELVLSNMETMESLAAKSEDLEEASRTFFENSKKANSCRRRWGCEIM